MTASTTDSMAVPPSSKMSLDFLTQTSAQLREPAELATALAKLDERLRESSIPYSDPLILDQEIAEADALLEDVVRTSKDPGFLENQKAQKILGFLGTRLERRLATARSAIARMRKDRITELPTELLMDIMSRVTNGTSNIGLDGDDFVSSDEHNRSRDVESIKCLRLTSRRMRNLADRFLIRSVTVRMMPHSLARLVEISHHPVFSHTVRCVKVNLAFYAKALANLNNFAGFEKWQCERIHERFGLANEKADAEEAEDHRVSDHTMTLLKRLDKEAIATREVKRGRDPFASLKTSFKRLLRTAHVRYKQLYDEQQRIRKDHRNGVDSAFLREISAAMARMPNATRLEISDVDVDPDWKDHYDRAHLEPVAAYLAAISSTPSLEKLHIGAGAFGNHMLDEWGDLRRWPLLASLIKSQPWPRLERLELDNVTLTSGLLEELIGERSTDMIVRLESVFIDEEDEDTWREMLDMLRAKADPDRHRKEGGVCGTVFVEALFAPYGGEIIDFLKRDIERIFGSRVKINDNAPLTPALSYLRGLRSKNPVPMVIGTPPLPPIHHLADDIGW
ncbi:hypothetical protein GCG54_00012897 [Colletotrichum gloeosporioides]|uniref:Uncharacterized protein n=1 Tax=Colletotrichum gloeosporioides TaxID=474922 RepID=A0A8H4CT80_COLGL|nr:uncharacterized protein GCG54_00012897 [Colletotrichum gloeosporioides]KAF3809610.1 hypothetical protein GCG54_00012897 [Colletotrichum gloeosporioides]